MHNIYELYNTTQDRQTEHKRNGHNPKLYSHNNKENKEHDKKTKNVHRQLISHRCG
jgi:hypothetical protein